MPTDNPTIGNFFIVDPNTGEKTEIEGVNELSITMLDKSLYNPYFDLAVPKEFTGTMTVKEIGMRMINMLHGRKIFKGSVEEIISKILELDLAYRVLYGYGRVYDIDLKQNKTHKKRRINKKWAKKHGYTCYVYYEGGDLN